MSFVYSGLPVIPLNSTQFYTIVDDRNQNTNIPVAAPIPAAAHIPAAAPIPPAAAPIPINGDDLWNHIRPLLDDYLVNLNRNELGENTIREIKDIIRLELNNILPIYIGKSTEDSNRLLEEINTVFRGRFQEIKDDIRTQIQENNRIQEDRSNSERNERLSHRDMDILEADKRTNYIVDSVKNNNYEIMSKLDEERTIRDNFITEAKQNMENIIGLINNNFNELKRDMLDKRTLAKEFNDFDEKLLDFDNEFKNILESDRGNHELSIEERIKKEDMIRQESIRVVEENTASIIDEINRNFIELREAISTSNQQCLERNIKEDEMRGLDREQSDRNMKRLIDTTEQQFNAFKIDILGNIEKQQMEDNRTLLQTINNGLQECTRKRERDISIDEKNNDMIVERIRENQYEMRGLDREQSNINMKRIIDTTEQQFNAFKIDILGNIEKQRMEDGQALLQTINNGLQECTKQRERDISIDEKNNDMIVERIRENQGEILIQLIDTLDQALLKFMEDVNINNEKHTESIMQLLARTQKETIEYMMGLNKQNNSSDIITTINERFDLLNNTLIERRMIELEQSRREREEERVRISKMEEDRTMREEINNTRIHKLFEDLRKIESRQHIASESIPIESNTMTTVPQRRLNSVLELNERMAVLSKNIATNLQRLKNTTSQEKERLQEEINQMEEEKRKIAGRS